MGVREKMPLLGWGAIALVVALAALGSNRIAARARVERPPIPAGEPRAPSVLFGVDGFEWSVILPLLRDGKMPALEALMARGVFGGLETMQPTLSPIIWTSIATGKTMHDHGIRGFVLGPVKDPAPSRLYNNRDRKTKAIWNILSDYGRSAAVIGWYMTYPVEPIRGLMVAQTNTPDQADRRQGRSILKGRLVADLAHQVYPPEREAEIMRVRKRAVEAAPARTRSIFGVFRHPMTLLTETHWKNSAWSLESDFTFLEIAKHLVDADERHDVLMVYASSADVLGHRFWRHHQPERFDPAPPDRELEDFGGLLEAYYRYLDREIGAFAQAMPSANLFVISDHGMHAVNPGADFDPEVLPDDMNRVHSGNHKDSPPGVFIAAGPDIRTIAPPVGLRDLHKKDLNIVASIYDVAPTLLALAGVPVGQDMRGRTLAEIFRKTPSNASVASHDDPGWLEARARFFGDAVEDPAEAERMAQLRALGYIE
ncbi:MAG: alkaline phosphatase family protein [Deltaproteobacteria bacterium]|nr:MAG: alkaline phosphatase family protein [Deltaproteobacteria bacterium]